MSLLSDIEDEITRSGGRLALLKKIETGKHLSYGCLKPDCYYCQRVREQGERHKVTLVIESKASYNETTPFTVKNGKAIFSQEKIWIKPFNKSITY